MRLHVCNLRKLFILNDGHNLKNQAVCRIVHFIRRFLGTRTCSPTSLSAESRQPLQFASFRSRTHCHNLELRVVVSYNSPQLFRCGVVAAARIQNGFEFSCEF